MAALKWFQHMLRENKFTSTFHAEEERKKAVIWTDAAIVHFGNCTYGRMAGILWKGGATEYFSKWSVVTNHDIMFYEAEAIEASLRLWHAKLQETRLTCFVDNTSAQGAIQKGYSKNAR